MGRRCIDSCGALPLETRRNKVESATQLIHASILLSVPECWRSSRAGDATTDPVYPVQDKPIGPSSFGQCKAVFRRIYKHQTAARVLSSNWDQIWTVHFDELCEKVKEREPEHKKLTHQEKWNGEFAPHTVVKWCDETESSF